MTATSRPPTGPDQASPKRIGPSPRDDRGLTLVEVLVVIAILGLAMLVGTTNWQSWRQARRVEDAADRVTALIRQARTEARRTSLPIEILIDAPAKRLQAEGLGRTLVLGDGVALQATLAALDDRPRITLLPDGSSSGGELLLSGTDMAAVRLTVSWIDGEVRRER